MTNTGTKVKAGRTAQRIEQLRTQLGVRTLFVAYGGGIRTRGMQLFDSLARIGSCDDPNSTECEPTIVADTPESLKTQLQSKIRQILLKDCHSLHLQLLQPYKREVLCIKPNLLMSNLANGKELS